MSTEIEAPSLSTADLVAAAKAPTASRELDPTNPAPAVPEPLAPLFLPAEAGSFRAAWDTVQIGFVNDPRQAVRKADELVAQVMKTLAESFAHERAKLESGVNEGSTEDLRVGLRRYRSFFQRLLAL